MNLYLSPQSSGPSPENLLEKFDSQLKERKVRVLVVDDERLIADTTAEILNGNGFDATPFYNGKKAVEAVREFCPDVVITDVMMPEVNGVELAKKIRSECPDTRVVLISGQAATADLLESARRQGYSFELLPKPLNPEVLLHKLTRQN